MNCFDQPWIVSPLCTQVIVVNYVSSIFFKIKYHLYSSICVVSQVLCASFMTAKPIFKIPLDFDNATSSHTTNKFVFMQWSKKPSLHCIPYNSSILRFNTQILEYSVRCFHDPVLLCFIQLFCLYIKGRQFRFHSPSALIL